MPQHSDIHFNMVKYSPYFTLQVKWSPEIHNRVGLKVYECVEREWAINRDPLRRGVCVCVCVTELSAVKELIWVHINIFHPFSISCSFSLSLCLYLPLFSFPHITVLFPFLFNSPLFFCHIPPCSSLAKTLSLRNYHHKKNKKLKLKRNFALWV